MNSYINSTDFFKGNNPEAIASEYGTPVYVYNEEIIRKSMETVEGVITKYPYTANYSVKANTNIEILKLALEEGLNCDAMSPGEITLLLKAGFPPEKIFFVSNNVAAEEMQFAIDKGVIVSLDSLDQLDRFGQINPGGRCAVRINPGVGAGHSEKVITAGKKTKFAIAEEDIDKIFEIVDKYDLKIVGINQHIGSGFLDPKPYIDAVTNLLRIADRFDNLEFIDFGGGYGIPYHKLDDEKPFPMEDFKVKLEPVLDEFVQRYGKTPLFKSEPGRYCVAEGSVILSRVQAIKVNAGIKYVGCDTGMNTLIRPAMYDSYHDIEVIRDGKVVDRDGNNDMETVNVSGPICETGDLIAKGRLLPKAKTGDLLAILDTGAYGYAMASSYNSRPRPAEVMITKEGKVVQIRRRETIEDLLSLF
ncbi:diaminopimelate decarboxylase [Lacrimispora saccharolytica]|uniref:diaminopimelate decarboxylase n=1 Tax=Lacrimispora saccharolytica TaxID=84030 RepID=UPI001B3D8D35|nr:diaminopimelate decarboxylase [Lacrimispora saccharolytica]MBP9000656.1 diaminopimelate decarboxylase [Lachnospiraceae bacterium]MCF2655870.1 diaminopimelate decarboxylase [Lacrimispora saccharolytica]MCI7558004.1 diaminopimelate decarboxylase [Lachnospiraceae bacterium]MDD7548648.1 diaminopimelate decarboxylase [Lachnospiraceae bacterium]MDY4126204.1 diaminopimelate decarboxylase [Lachnospiraceae bacterium]